MNTLSTLLNQFWIVKEGDRADFFALQRGLSDCRKFIQENIGWRLMVTENMLRLEKTTTEPQAYMGIRSFMDQKDYMLFCALLVFLEDMEEKTPFLLSELVSFLSVQLGEVMDVDWTSFALRKSLIRTMQYAVKMKLIVLHEGSLDQNFEAEKSEALYENTGLSRYFAVHYTFDTSECESVEDYRQQSLQSADMDRGHFRTNRVYQRLLSVPGLYWQDNADPEVDYLRKQRLAIERNMKEQIGARLDVHQNAAYLMFEEESDDFGEVFPNQNTLSDVILLMCTEIQSLQLKKNEDDTAILPKQKLHSVVLTCQKKYGNAWSKEYAAMDENLLIRKVIEEMVHWQFIVPVEDHYLVLPGLYRLSGTYPKDFVPGSEPKKKKEKTVELQQLF